MPANKLLKATAFRFRHFYNTKVCSTVLVLQKAVYVNVNFVVNKMLFNKFGSVVLGYALATTPLCGMVGVGLRRFLLEGRARC